MMVRYIRHGGPLLQTKAMAQFPRVGDHVEIDEGGPAKEVVRVLWENSGYVSIFLVDT